MSAPAVRPPAPGEDLAAAHRRFARAAVGIYMGAGAVALALLVVSLLTDQAHQEESAQASLLLETDLRADHLSHHLLLLGRELRRLGLRTEINLLDEDARPEQVLLQLAHDKSAFFNLGVAILDAGGRVAWSEPQTFLVPGTSLAAEPWFQALPTRPGVTVVPVRPGGKDASLLYVVSPIHRGGVLGGVLVGGIELTPGGAALESLPAHVQRTTLLTTRGGLVVYPPEPPPWSTGEAGRSVLARQPVASFLATLDGDGERRVVASAPVAGTELWLHTAVEEAELLGPARVQLVQRLGLGLLLAVLPLALLVLLLGRSLRIFRAAEARAIQAEQLHHLGEAVSLIAHEIKNALNAMSVGLDVALGGEGAGPRRGHAAGAVKTEIRRLTDFTQELLVFAKGVKPRPAPVDLVVQARRVAELLEAKAADLDARLELTLPPGDTLVVRADPSLVHVVITNLVGNALDAAASSSAAVPRVELCVSAAPGRAEVRVRDNGPGVAAAVRARLGEPFVTGKPSGTGLGLALSMRIARAHGGDLVLESNDGGATFLFWLPREAGHELTSAGGG